MILLSVSLCRKSASRQRFLRYLRAWATVAGLGAAAIATTNALVDPFGTYRLLGQEALENARLRKGGARTTKAEALRRGGCDTLILGTSRAEVGIDPAHPAWGSEGVYDAAMSGTNMYETRYVFRYALAHNDLRRVVLFADFLMFNDGRTTGFDFAQSRFNPDLNLFEYHLQQLLSLFATEATKDVLSQLLKQRQREARYTFKGNLLRAEPRKPPDHRRAFHVIIRGFLLKDDLYGNYHLGRLDVFDEIVQTCRRRNIELIVVIAPCHALQLEAIGVAGLWDTFESWKRQLASRLGGQTVAQAGGPSFALWDFTGYRGYVSEEVPPADRPEQRMKWYWESSHFKKELGDLVLARVLGRGPSEQAPPADFGVRLTPGNIESHLAAIRRDRQAYAAAHGQEIEFVKSVAAEVKLAAGADAALDD